MFPLALHWRAYAHKRTASGCLYRLLQKTLPPFGYCALTHMFCHQHRIGPRVFYSVITECDLDSGTSCHTAASSATVTQQPSPLLDSRRLMT